MAKRKIKGQTTQWPKEKSTNNDLQNTTDRATGTQLKTGGTLRCSGMATKTNDKAL